MDVDYVPDSATLTEIVGDVFTGLFGDEIDRPFEMPFDETLPVAASVTVSGGWHGRVVFCCSTPFARHAAAEVFGMPLEDVADDEVRDVVGEFANHIGGNVKSFMRGPSTLSLPSASLSGPTPVDGEFEAVRVDMVWRDQPLRVSIWKMHSQVPTEGNPS